MSDIDATVLVNGHEVPFSGAVALMDDDIREELHSLLAPCSEQAFINAYVSKHAEKFGDEFVVN